MTGVEALPAKGVSDLVAFAHYTQLRLWLVCDHELPDRVLDAVCAWPAIPISQADFDRHWRRRPRPQPLASEGVMEFPAVPNSDFPTFRADINRLLSPGDAAVATVSYDQHLSHGRELVADLDFDDETTTADTLRAALAHTSTASEAIIAMRAFQAAAFEVGWFVQVDLTMLLASGDHLITAAAEDPSTWRRLVAYRQAWRSAVCAALLATVDPARLVTLTCGDVARDGSTIRDGDTTVDVPAGAEPFLVAQLADRYAEGARDSDLFFVGNDGAQLSSHRVTIAVGDAARDLDIHVVAGRVDRQERHPRVWRNRRGISIADIR